MSRRAFLPAALAALAACGCGRSPFVPVSGVVTLDGEPLAGAVVSFQPDAAAGAWPGSYARTEPDGTFRLKVVGTDRPGAAVGRHRVSVRAPEARTEPDPLDLAPSPKDRVPARYNARSELTFDVPPGGTADARFDLRSR